MLKLARQWYLLDEYRGWREVSSLTDMFYQSNVLFWPLQLLYFFTRFSLFRQWKGIGAWMLNNIRKAAATPRRSGQKSRSMPTSSGELLKDRSRDLVVAGYAIVQGTLGSRPVAGHCLYLIIVLYLAFLTVHFGFGLYKSVSQSSGQIIPRMPRVVGRIGGSHFGFDFGAFTTKLRQGGF